MVLPMRIDHLEHHHLLQMPKERSSKLLLFRLVSLLRFPEKILPKGLDSQFPQLRIGPVQMKRKLPAESLLQTFHIPLLGIHFLATVELQRAVYDLVNDTHDLFSNILYSKNMAALL